MERPLAWQRPLQLPASMDEAWMALRLRQGMGPTLVVGLQPLGLRQISVAAEVVVGLPRILGLRRLPLVSQMALHLPLYAIPIPLVRDEA